MLSMNNVSKVFRTDLIETHALRNFSLDVKAGEFLAVTGPSGSGKTTFLNIAGLLEPYETGSYKLDGVDVTRAFRRCALAPAQPEDRLHLPELQPDARPQRLRQRRRAAALPAHEIRGTRQAHHQCARDRRPGRAHEAHAGAAVGRPAAARGHRARHRRRPQAGAGRRAHRQPGFADGAPGHGPARDASTRWAPPSSWSRTIRSWRAARIATCRWSTARSPTSSLTSRTAAPAIAALRRCTRSPLPEPEPCSPTTCVSRSRASGATRASPRSWCSPSRWASRCAWSRSPVIARPRAIRPATRSDMLFAPSIDSWDPGRSLVRRRRQGARRPTMLTYRDARGAVRVHDSRSQAHHVQGRRHLQPRRQGHGAGIHRDAHDHRRTSSRCSRRRFCMAAPGTPRRMRAPSPWWCSARKPTRRPLAARTASARPCCWHDREFRVVGVLNDWEPSPSSST